MNEIKDAKRFRYERGIMLLMLRCGYIEIISLTAKGRGNIPAWAWRLYNDLMVSVSNRHRNAVFKILESASGYADHCKEQIKKSEQSLALKN